jgi:hypothetical protein
MFTIFISEGRRGQSAICFARQVPAVVPTQESLSSELQKVAVQFGQF